MDPHRILDEMEAELAKLRRILADFRNRIVLHNIRWSGTVEEFPTPVESPDGEANSMPEEFPEKSTDTLH